MLDEIPHCHGLSFPFNEVATAKAQYRYSGREDYRMDSRSGDRRCCPPTRVGT